MKILPATTNLPDSVLRPRHAPNAKRYQDFKPCLRWDYGFTCAFCFLHEADFVEHGAQGTGLMSVEHRSPQSKAKSKINRYSNCLLACRFCNQARADRPVTDPNKRHLLDPRHSVWGKRFAVVGDALAPRLNDGDAAYTAEAYDLGDERKKLFRESRRTRILAALKVVAESVAKEKQLLAIATRVPVADAKVLVKAAQQLRGDRVDALDQLRRYQVVPLDAGRCGCATPRRLPTWLEKQGLSIP